MKIQGVSVQYKSNLTGFSIGPVVLSLYPTLEVGSGGSAPVLFLFNYPAYSDIPELPYIKKYPNHNQS